MAKPRDAGLPPFGGGKPEKLKVLEKKLGYSAGPERLDGPPPADSPSGSGGKRHTKPVTDNDSNLERLEEIAASGWVWKMVEAHEERHNRDRPPNPPGRKQQYKLFDIVLLEVATVLYRNATDAVNNLRDPKNWARLPVAAEDAFPNDPSRRLSEKAPSRYQRHRARKKYLNSELLDELFRHYTRPAVETAKDMDLFLPKSGSWTHPHKDQSIVADMSWVPGATRHHRDAPFDPKTGKPLRCDRNGDFHHYSNGQPTKTPGRKMVMMSCRTGYGNERIILDAGFMPHNDSVHRKPGNEADFAVDMLRDLIADNHDLLRGKTSGLRCFIHDMAMHSRTIDDVLDMRILPVSKTPKLKGGKYRHGNLGLHEFTPRNGPPEKLNIRTANGSMWVALPDKQGTEWAVPLERRHIYWGTEGKQRSIAYIRAAIPQDAPASHLRGATAIVRLNSTPEEIHNNPHTRRTRSLRAIPEADEDFEIYGAREDIESTFGDFKRRMNGKLNSIYEDNYRFNVLAYMILRLSRTRVAYRNRTATTATQAVPIAA